MPEEKIQTITLSELQRINHTVLDLVQDELLKMGIEVKIGSSQYSDSSTGCCKLEFKTVGGLSQEALLLENSWQNFGFKANPRGCEIFYNRKHYQVVGLKSRARKNPIIVRHVESGSARSPMGSLPEIAWPPFERRVSHVLTSHAPSTSARSSDRPQPTSVASKSGGVGSTGLTSNSR